MEKVEGNTLNMSLNIVVAWDIYLKKQMLVINKLSLNLKSCDTMTFIDL